MQFLKWPLKASFNVKYLGTTCKSDKHYSRNSECAQSSGSKIHLSLYVTFECKIPRWKQHNGELEIWKPAEDVTRATFIFLFL